MARKSTGDLEALLDTHCAKAEANAAARALAIIEGVDPKQADALEYMIKMALMQWYHQGAIDAIARVKAMV